MKDVNKVKKEVQGAITEHWLDKRIREHKSTNLVGNLIRISAKDLLTLHQYKQSLMGTNRSISEESEESKLKQTEYEY